MTQNGHVTVREVKPFDSQPVGNRRDFEVQPHRFGQSRATDGLEFFQTGGGARRRAAHSLERVIGEARLERRSWTLVESQIRSAFRVLLEQLLGNLRQQVTNGGIVGERRKGGWTSQDRQGSCRGQAPHSQKDAATIDTHNESQA